MAALRHFVNRCDGRQVAHHMGAAVDCMREPVQAATAVVVVGRLARTASLVAAWKCPSADAATSCSASWACTIAPSVGASANTSASRAAISLPGRRRAWMLDTARRLARANDRDADGSVAACVVLE
jgi:hypothetical protein